MLKFYIFVIELLFIFSFLLGVNFSVLTKEKIKNKKFVAIPVITISLLGLIATTILTVLRQRFPQKMVKYTLYYNRWSLAYSMFFILLSFIFLIIFYLYKKNKFRLLFLIIYEVASFIAIWFLGFTIFPQLYILSGEFIAFGETSFGTQSLVRMSGYFLGLLTIFLIGLSLYKINLRLKEKQYKIFTILIITISFFDFFLRGISALARLRILKSSNPFVFEIMILEDKSLTYIFILLTIVSIIFSSLVFLNSKNVVEVFRNKALLRKEKIRLIKNRRWSISLVSLVLLSLVSTSLVKSYINRAVELSSPEGYQIEDNNIVIPLTDVEDGHLHRFSYIAEGGNNVRFIVVKKPRGGSYGLGLDACDICGVAGYFERDDEIVCKRCDVVMNKATIGFRGGCNPIPFEYEIKDKKIYVNKAVLEKEKDRFPMEE